MATWQEINNKRKPFIRMGERLFGGMLGNIRKSLMSEIRKVDNVQHIERVVDGFQFDAELWDKYEKFYVRTAPYFAKDFINRYKSIHQNIETKEEDMWIQKIIEYVRATSGKKITSITDVHIDDIMRAVGSAVETGIDQGWGMEKIARSINKNLTNIDTWKALQIARTETGAASSYGVELGADELPGNKMKVWISSFNTTSRGARPNDQTNHMAMDGQMVAMGQPFIEPMTQDEIMRPHDPGALPRQTVNCNCAHEVIITDEIY